MIGIVVVSHSPALAEAAVALAGEMVREGGPAVRVAAGAGDDVTGTDATRVADAIRAVAGPDGVLVLMDLGSAVLSAELALELAADLDVPVRLSAAPFVEGLVAAVVRAAGGASLDEVDEEARIALAPKIAALGEPGAPDAASAPGASVPAASAGAASAGAASAGADAAGEPASSAEITLLNPSGLHARPVAELVRRLSAFDARVTATNPRTGRGPVRADSTIALLTLGAQHGDTVRFDAAGPQAAEAIDAVRLLAANGFGEGTVPDDG
ncbi:dihydroxyacetone kinase phosphoryl donor subunit DhaM [Galbitalea sp. SE-J8]|uniref:dihydroxyacetone kinase phosphoryl donor subunit DhaM n=1 Tax=Galbitalea sp. SE-J8 TaxID=3054952 RepID=UPI00259C6A24|nr:dihydroxyacetone kinase phosphoryl donor subunit DhaM [Galbitalea sp. SE-J8]MDM4761411.1 dihydroxyacetone kinase phosphoryl donor subunit DhaM [Galbitalea sp. SE-J8]